MKAGLEVHQQLATGKLFCACPAELTERTEVTFVRRLRPAGGEERTVDAATAFQASRGLAYRYESGPCNCLVEGDEEPPRSINEEALDVALTVAILLGSRPVDELQVMRKIVVDGSNTTGFQRTALVAVGGQIEVGGRTHPVLSICLEEDAARRIGGGDGEVAYRLDRLGIPLVEIATGPTIASGAEAREVAQEIGALLRATRRVRRGIGTIREDLNVSADGGARVEIKGVQELRLIGEYVDREVGRQRHLLEVRDALQRRGARAPGPPVDARSALTGVGAGPLASALAANGVVLALALPGFAGLLGGAPGSDERLGRELADHARAAGLGGLVHSDEGAVAGLTVEIIGRLRAELTLGADDGYALVADRRPERARRAAERVAARAREALTGVPGETRDPLPDARTRYSRPLPGRDRMYPETDVPPVPIDEARLARLRDRLPERPGATMERLTGTYSLAPELARQLVYGGELERFDELVRRGRAPGAVARLLIQELPAVPLADGAPPFEPPLDRLDELLRGAERGTFAKEALAPLLTELARGAPDLETAVARAGVRAASDEELAGVVDRVVRAQIHLVRERGSEAFAPLMGDVMRELRGRRDGREVAEELRRVIARYRADTSAPGAAQ